VLVAPAMNARMWSHPATQANVSILQERGVELIGPEEGELAEGETGVGRMAEPEAIAARCEELLRPPSLAGRRVLVTAGGTREPLDSVRFLGNRSSGRMGVALAREARRRGAEVTLLAANLAVDPPAGVEVVQAPTAEDVARETLARGDADIVVMAAAVADYRPAQAHDRKRPKDEAAWEVTLEPTLDVLRELGSKRRNGAVLVGFAADEGEGGLERARAKRGRKGADLIVFNDVGRTDIGFDAVENEVVVISAEGERQIRKAPKERIAAAVLDEAEALLEERDGRPGRR
jgi:phosphopantothenoylcysteine decarboxylase/phosphopantothenate--cysteine ligase